MKSNDADIDKEYSEITDVDILVKKLADESYKIVRKHWLSIFTGQLDELLETEIKKYSHRLKQLQDADKNFLQKWFG